MFSALGTFSVQLIATDYSGCSDTIVKTMVVDHAPVSAFTYTQPCDPPGVIYFNDSSFVVPGASPIIEWLWELEPGQFSSQINPVYTFEQADTCYMVSLTVTDANGCSNTFMDSVCVSPPLGVDFAANRVCHGYATFLHGQYLPEQDSITSWRWDMGNGVIITTGTDTISYTYPNPGTYFVTLTIENTSLCERSVTHQVIVDALPQVAFAFSPSLCDEPTQFTDMSVPGYGALIESWLWDFGDVASGAMNTSTEQNPVHLYPPNDSSYLVTLIVTNSHGCTDSLSLQLDKGLCMQALFEVSGNGQCNNTGVCFTDNSFIVGDNYFIQSWHWDFGDGQSAGYTSVVDSVCHTYEEWGDYTVSLVITSVVNGIVFADTTAQTITVSAVPQAMISVDIPCVMAPTRFTDISASHGVPITAWQWDFGDAATVDDTSSLQNPVYAYAQAGEYTVTMIAENANGCSDTLRQDISVYNNPLAGFSVSLACAGGMTAFTDESTPAEGELTQWQWSFGNGQEAEGQNPLFVYPDPGTYLVQMTVTDEFMCQDTAQWTLEVFPVPLSAFDIVNNYQGIQGQILLDNLSQNAVRYAWDLGNGDTSAAVSPVVRYDQNGTYLIELISWNDNNCPDTAYMEYQIVFQGLYVPTGFTPDGKDQALNIWKPVGMNLEQYRVTVINERGNIVWQSEKLDENGSPIEGWDGTTNGEPMPVGTYLWTISAKFRDGRIWEGTDAGDGNTNKYGMLLLIR